MAAEGSGVGSAPAANPAPSSSSSMGKPTGILSAVDQGEAPVFGEQEIEERKAKKEGKAPTLQAKPPQTSKPAQQAKAPELQKQESTPAEPASDIFSFLEQEFGPKNPTQEISPEAAGLQENTELSEDEQKVLGPRAQARIQALSSSLQQERARAVQDKQASDQRWNEVVQRDAQFQNYFAQMGQAMQTLQVQNAELRGALQHGRMPGVAQADEDPIEALKGKMGFNEFAETNKALQARLDRFEQEHTKSVQAQEQHRQQVEINQKKEWLNSSADQAAKEVLLAGFAPEAAHRLSRRAGTLTLALGWGKQVPPPEAAKALRQFCGEFALELLRAKSAELKERTKAGQEVQPSTATGRSNASARGAAMPGAEDMRKLDPKAKDALDFMFRNNPPVI